MPSQSCYRVGNSRFGTPFSHSATDADFELTDFTNGILRKDTRSLLCSRRADREGVVKLLEVNPDAGWCWDGKQNLMAGFKGCDTPNFLAGF